MKWRNDLFKPFAGLRNRAGANLLFIGTMGAGAALGMVRGFAIAAILPVDGFGLYALIVAVAAFISPLFGFGKIEETRKLFPRLFVDGNGRKIVALSDQLTISYIRILAIFGLGLVAPCIMFFGREWLLSLLASLLIVFSGAWSSILASALRSGNGLLKMGASALIRAVAMLVLGIVGAMHFGFSGAIWGEAAGGIFGSIVARILLARVDWTHDALEKSAEQKNRGVSVDGLMIFIAALFAAAPVYLGRTLVGAGYSSSDLGTYSFLMLIVIAMVTALGISDQMTGPKFVMLERTGATLPDQKRRFTHVIIFNCVMVAVICLAFTLAIGFGPLNQFTQKYALAVQYILPVWIFCILQITTTIDWFLLAHDKESVVLSSSTVSCLIYLGLALWVILMGWALVWILWAHVATKAVQLAFQFRAIVQLHQTSGV